MKRYVYGLYNPLEPDVICYVGQTQNMRSRFDAHRRGASNATAEWIVELQKLGVPPCIKLIEVTDSTNATTVEAKHIKAISPKLNQPTKFTSFNSKLSPEISLEDMQIRHIICVLEHCNGNKKKAAKLLGIGRQTLYNKLEQIEQRKPQ